MYNVQLSVANSVSFPINAKFARKSMVSFTNQTRLRTHVFFVKCKAASSVKCQINVLSARVIIKNQVLMGHHAFLAMFKDVLTVIRVMFARFVNT